MISILSPTRNRPHLIMRLIDSIFDTAANPEDIELSLYIDDDDASYDDLLSQDLGIKINYMKGPKIVISDMWNKCYEISNGEILHHASDDFVYRSKDWDVKVESHFDRYNDKILLLYGRDGHQDEKLGTLSFVHRNWVEALGYVVPPYFMVDWCDNWINDIARDIGRRVYDPEIYTEHLHWHAGKSELDETYREREVVRQQVDSHGLYIQTAHLRLEDVKKLATYIEEHNTHA